MFDTFSYGCNVSTLVRPAPPFPITRMPQVSMPSKTHPGAREFLLLFPYYERGTVWDAIVKASENGPPWPYPEPVALRTFLDACCGVNAMHAKGYAHRDMKVNVLVFIFSFCFVVVMVCVF